MARYSYDEAIDIMLKHADRFGFPRYNEDYQKSDLDLEEIFAALDVGGKLTKSISKNNTKKYAAVNIEVLRAVCHRKGEIPPWDLPLEPLY